MQPLMTSHSPMKHLLPKTILTIVILFQLSLHVQCQDSRKPKDSFSVVFYNVENLYDTLDDPLTNDDDFTPAGKVPWTTDRYQVKLKNLSKVISSVLAPSLPDLVGFAEVENKAVLEELLKTPELKQGGYAIIHQDSPDERGSDVALIYRKESFRLMRSIAIPVALPGDKTRDILYVQGKTPDGTLMNIFVNHWPSRREGTETSEPRRIIAAGTLKKTVDSLFQADRNANILIMGDFNDNPDNRSIAEVLGATKPGAAAEARKLYNLLSPLHASGKGSLYYKSWDLFDQLIVSGNLLVQGKGPDCKPGDAGIFDAEWLMFKTSAGEMRPNRTMGSRYYGGYSDHLPVYVTFR